MPQNIVVGEDAKHVACFVAKYSGQKAKAAPGSATAAQSPGLQVPGADTCPK
jgi:hypothetical protein